MLKDKLVTEDLMELKENAEITIKERLDLGNVELEGKFFFAQLMLPYDIMPENKPALLLKHKSYDKFRFTLNEDQILKSVNQLTESERYSNDYVLVKDEYQVFLRSGVVMYLNEQEIGEIVAIFSKLKSYVPVSSIN